MYNDSLSFMFSLINSASISSRGDVVIKNSKKCLKVLSVLYRQGYIRGFVVSEKTIKILIKFNGLSTRPTISYIKSISLNGRPFFVSLKALTHIAHMNETFILSTPKGFLTLKEAIQENTGGLLICKIL